MTTCLKRFTSVPSVLSRVTIDNERKSATRGSRADEGVRPRGGVYDDETLETVHYAAVPLVFDRSA